MRDFFSMLSLSFLLLGTTVFAAETQSRIQFLSLKSSRLTSVLKCEFIEEGNSANSTNPIIEIIKDQIGLSAKVAVPEHETIQSRNIQTGSATREQFLKDQDSLSLAQIAQVNPDLVLRVDSYEVNRSNEGSLVALLVFIGKRNKVLGVSGVMGWTAGVCHRIK